MLLSSHVVWEVFSTSFFDININHLNINWKVSRCGLNHPQILKQVYRPISLGLYNCSSTLLYFLTNISLAYLHYTHVGSIFLWTERWRTLIVRITDPPNLVSGLLIMLQGHLCFFHKVPGTFSFHLCWLLISIVSFPTRTWRIYRFFEFQTLS